MSEMVDRVARASFAWWAEHNKNGFVFEDMPDDERMGCLLHARRMIEAMREPTEGMLGSPSDIDCYDQSYVYEGQIKEIWQAMINEALKEK